MSVEEEIPTIYIGKKPLISYIIVAISMLLNEKVRKIRISARGAGISRAVDVSEILRTRYLPKIIDIERINIGTDTLKNPEGRIDRVSFIEIVLVKKV